MSKLLTVQHRRVLSRQKAALYLTVLVILLYLFFQRSQRAHYQVWRQAVDLGNTVLGGSSPAQAASEEIQWTPATPVTDGEPPVSEEELKQLFEADYLELGKYVYPRPSRSLLLLNSVPESQVRVRYTETSWQL